MNIYARTASAFCLLSTLTGVPATHSGEYYIYRESKGVPVIGNQKPPAASKIIKQQTLADEMDAEPQSLRTVSKTPLTQHRNPKMDKQQLFESS